MTLGTRIQLDWWTASSLWTDRTDFSFYAKWANVQFDGTLEALDNHIATMTSCALVLIDTHHEDDPEEMLNGIEWFAYATVVKMQQLAALGPNRQNPLLLDAGTLLCEAVGQYLPFLAENVRQAILAGVEQAERHVDAHATKLSPVEIEWQRWLLPRLSAHLVLSF